MNFFNIPEELKNFKISISFSKMLSIFSYSSNCILNVSYLNDNPAYKNTDSCTVHFFNNYGQLNLR